MLFWLSFANQQGFLGAAIIDAPDLTSAIRQSWDTRTNGRPINPGGEVMGVPIPPGFEPDARPYRNRLLGRDEIERIFGENGFPDIDDYDTQVQYVDEDCAGKLKP